MTFTANLEPKPTDLTPSQVAEWINDTGFFVRGYALVYLQWDELALPKVVKWTWLRHDDGRRARVHPHPGIPDRDLEETTRTINHGGWHRANAHIIYNEANP